MNDTTPNFEFPITYAGEDITCKVTMQSNRYTIAFNDRPMGEIQTTDEATWIQTSGAPLPDSIVEIIVGRIESQYL